MKNNKNILVLFILLYLYIHIILLFLMGLLIKYIALSLIENKPKDYTIMIMVELKFYLRFF